MPKRAKELSAIQVRRIDKPGMHAVGGVAGLLLQVTEGEGRSWVLRARVGNRRRHVGLGPYPEVSLAQARDKAREAKEQLRKGIDPVAERQAARDALRADQAARISFAEAARECHAAREKEFRNAKHRRDWLSSLERYAFPTLGGIPVGDVGLPHILQVLEPIWYQRTETATRVRQRMETVLSWATVSGYRTGDNPARWQGNLKEVLAAPNKLKKPGHFKALPWPQVPTFMQALRQRDGMGTRALEFAILTAARSGEVRGATWDEIDLTKRVWIVPADRIKAGKAHRVPLSNDAMALLQSLSPMAESRYVFPAPRGGPLSDMSLSAVLRRMGVDATVHGFRSSFKDWCRNRTSYPDEVSELALAHVSTDATRAAYARDELLPQRTRLMADWAQFIREGNATGIAEITAIGEAGAWAS